MHQNAAVSVVLVVEPEKWGQADEGKKKVHIVTTDVTCNGRKLMLYASFRLLAVNDSAMK